MFCCFVSCCVPSSGTDIEMVLKTLRVSLIIKGLIVYLYKEIQYLL